MYMTKNPLLSVLIASLLLLSQVSPALAVEIVITDTGMISFYQDQVLGENDDEKVEEDEVIEESPAGAAEKSRENESEKRSEPRQKKPEPVRKDAPTRQVSPGRDQKLKIKPTGDKVEIRLESKKAEQNENRKEKTPERFENREVLEAERLKLELSSELKKDEDKGENDTENTQRELLTEDERIRSEVKERILQERRERLDEKIEIESQTDKDGNRELEFRSRAVKAKLSGAEFSVDPETNEVTVTTPNGNEHTLTHLPDQAIERLKAAGVIDPETETDGEREELEVKTKEDGRVVYAAKVNKMKRLFGLIPRQVETQVELDDDSGEIEESEVAANPYARLLNRLSR